jgi:hypothetical protein
MTTVAHEFAKGHGGQAVKRSLVALAVAATLGTPMASVAATNHINDYTGYTTTISSGVHNGVAAYSYNTNFGVGVRTNTIQSNTVNIGANATINGYHGGPFNYSYNGISAIAEATSSSSGSLATANVITNHITNNGYVYAYNNGVALFAYAQAQVAAANVTGNVITNNGRIVGYGAYDSNYNAHGISLYADAQGQVQANASVNSNVITNSGSITSDRSVISLIAQANADVLSVASVNGNVITNNVNTDNHINLGLATTTTSTYGNVNGIELIAYSGHATSSVASVGSNVITNHGTIDAGYDGYGSGVLLKANAYDAYNANASITNNTIANTGTIVGQEMGVAALAEANGFSATALISGNVVTNAAKATISANASYSYYSYNDGDAVRFKARAGGEVSASASVLSNTITNNGVIYANHDTVYLTSSSAAGSATSVTGSNTITNTGLFNAGTHGVHLASYAYGNHSGVATTELNTIVTTRGSRINSYSQSVKIRAMAYADNDYSSASVATNSRNVIQNAGTMFAYGNDAIDFKAKADSTSHRTEGIPNTYDNGHHIGWNNNRYVLTEASSVAANDLNVITNTGEINANSGSGINLYSGVFQHGSRSGNLQVEASALGFGEDWNFWNFGASDVLMHAVANNSTSTTNSNNVIVNSGSIVASNMGINLHSFGEASARAFADISYSYITLNDARTEANATATASNVHNTITNSGSIRSLNSAINLYSGATAHSEALTKATDIGNIAWFTVYDDTWGGHNVNNTAVSNAYAKTSNNTITNSGTLTSNNGSGIYLGASADSRAYANTNRSNTGLARFYSNNSYATAVATAAVDHNTITNAGMITANNGAGVSLNAYALAISDTNWGGNGPTGEDSNAFAHIFNNTINNSGTIVAEDGIKLSAGARANDIWANYSQSVVYGNTINNSGTIKASHDGIVISAGVYTGGNYGAHVTENTITNTGRITAGHIGVYLTNYRQDGHVYGNTINNSGLIVSTHGEDAVAIRVVGDSNQEAGNYLNLTAPAFIAGRIELDDHAYFNVNLTSGPSHSVNWTIDQSGDYGVNSNNVSTTGPVPWFRDNNNLNFATIDPTAFSAAVNILGDTSAMASKMASKGIDRAEMSKGKSATWMTVEAGQKDYDGDGAATLNQRTNLYAIAVGYSQQLNDDVMVGGMLGYNRNNLNVSSPFTYSYKNSLDSVFGGLSLRTKLGDMVQVDLGLNGGYMSHNDNRFVNDNLMALGNSHATSSYNSTWLSPEITLSVPYTVMDGLTLAPRAGVRYSAQWIDSYTESGSNANASVASRTLGVVDAKLGASLTKSFELGRVSVYADYIRRDSVGDDKVNVTMIGDNHDVSFFYKNINAGIVGLDATYDVTDVLSFTATGSYTQGDTVSGGNVTGNLKFLF